MIAASTSQSAAGGPTSLNRHLRSTDNLYPGTIERALETMAEM
jgi:hypothetical protein